MQLLFLKRLENDGASITISEQDRQLLKNFGNVEEEVADKDLEKAILHDRVGRNLSTEEVATANAILAAEKELEQQENNINQDGKRNPDPFIEKLRISKMKACCAQTKAVSQHGTEKRRLKTAVARTNQFTGFGKKDQVKSTGKINMLNRIQTTLTKSSQHLMIS